MRARIWIVAMLALAGCATPARNPINAPAAHNAAPAEPLSLEGDVIALAMSGGGARAAAFSLGVLQGLREMPAGDGRTLLDHVALVTSVSGGSITAGYFGQHGPAGLDTFRAAYLDKDWAAQLHLSPLWPANWVRAMNGGLNGEDKLADWLDAEVFAGGRMRDLARPGHPRIWLNSADLYNGTPFAFTPLYFDAICSDLASVRIADAVAASMAVPVAFRPILVEPYPQRCAAPPAWESAALADRGSTALLRETAQAFVAYRNPARMRYVHLVDGGIIDNLGLSSLSVMRRAAATPYGPFTPRDAVRVRRMTFLVVNAEMVRDVDWQMRADGPTGAETLSTAFDVSIEAANRAAYDNFRQMIADWQRELRAYRCALSAEEVARLRGGLDGWVCDDLHFVVDMISFADLDEARRRQLGLAPTAVSLPPASIDALIAGGRDLVQANAAARAAAP